MSSKKKKCNVQFVNDLKKPLSVKVYQEPKLVYKNNVNSKKIVNNGKSCLSNKCDERYSTPEINTTLRCAQAILELENLYLNKNQLHKKKPSVSFNKMTDAEQTIYKKKLMESITFPLDVSVYNNLISLNITDDDIMRHMCRRKTIIAKKTNDIVPNLSDFFVPKTKTEYKAQVDVVNIVERPVQSFNGTELYQKISTWHIDADI